MKYTLKAKTTLIPAILLIVLTGLAGCKKSGTSPKNNDPNNAGKSAADQLEGSYSGAGKYLPNNVNVGTYNSCVTPAESWATNFVTGTATVSLSKLTDSTVKVEFSGNGFPNITITDWRVKINGNSINFFSLQASGVTVYSGSFNVTSKTLVFSHYLGANTSFGNGTLVYLGLSGTGSCDNDFPYYYGNGLQLNGTFTYYTIGHVDFSGKKQ